MRVLSIFALACVFVALGQDPRSAMEQSIAKQRAALETQRASVRTQTQGDAGTTSSFFTTPWSGPPAWIVGPDTRPVRPPECDPVSEDEIGPIVQEIAHREGFTPDLLRAVIEKESGYLPCAVSPAGAQGLMQLMPDTAAGLGVSDPFNVRENVDAGARFLKQLMDRYNGNLVLALAAYNAGPNRVDAAGGVPYVPETMNYVSWIIGKLTTH
jgi:hypothetical protein